MQPHPLLDALQKKLNIKTDVALSKQLDIKSTVLSKIRHRRINIGSGYLIRMHEVSDLSIRELKALRDSNALANKAV